MNHIVLISLGAICFGACAIKHNKEYLDLEEQSSRACSEYEGILHKKNSIEVKLRDQSVADLPQLEQEEYLDAKHRLPDLKENCRVTQAAMNKKARQAGSSTEFFTDMVDREAEPKSGVLPSDPQ